MLWYILEILSSLWNNKTDEDDDVEPPNEGWIALLSETEQWISQEQQNVVATDLRSIASRWSKLKAFPRILSAVQEVLVRYDPERLQEVSSFSLPSDIKHRIFKDVLNELSPKWVEEIGRFAPEVEGNWYPERYRQNILGEMISITSHTSPDHLSMIGLSQTIKTIHLSLVQSLNGLRKKPISSEESSEILDLMISSVIVKVVDLWIETVDNCKNTLPKEGLVTERIKQEDRAREEHLAKLKESDQIDARYSSGDSDRIRQAYLEGRRESLLSETEFDQLRSSVHQLFK